VNPNSFIQGDKNAQSIQECRYQESGQFMNTSLFFYRCSWQQASSEWRFRYMLRLSYLEASAAQKIMLNGLFLLEAWHCSWTECFKALVKEAANGEHVCY